MLHPFAEQKPNSETIASFLDFEDSFQLYVGRQDWSLCLFPTAAITDGNRGLAGRDRRLAAHPNSQTNDICIYNCV